MVNVKRPNIPGLTGLSPELRQVLAPIKELLQIHEGRTGASGERFVKMSELGSLDLVGRSDVRPSIGGAPAAPTDVEAVGGAWGNRISWINATDQDLWAVEVFAAAGSDDWTLSAQVATVTIPQARRGKSSQYVHFPDDLLSDHYYWVRSVDYAGNASRLAPADPEAGLYVPGSGTVGQTVDRILDALEAPNAPAWDSEESGYRTGDIVTHNTGKLYQCYNAPVPAGTEPGTTAGADYWRRTGLVRQGKVDGTPTVGIAGELVVDDTIYARHLVADDIQSTLIDTQELTVDYSLIVGTKPPADADVTQTALDNGADIDNAKANGYTLINGGYLATEILTADHIQTGTLDAGFVKVSSSDGNTYLDGNTMYVYDGSGNLRVKLGLL